MANLDWVKIEQVALAHEWLALLAFAWVLSIPLYIILQAWFGYAWTGRWRIAALIPLIGLVALALTFVIGELRDPDVFGPPATGPFDNPILAVVFFAPLGLIYFAIAGVIRLSVRKPRRNHEVYDVTP